MTPVREAALELLDGVKGVFLRCDRGDALYVTNEPMRTEQKIDWEAAGFRVREERGLAFLLPDDCWADRIYEWASERVGMGPSEARQQVAQWIQTSPWVAYAYWPWCS